MYNLKIDTETNDLLFDNKQNLVLVSESEEKMQQIERSLTTRLTEWFLNTSIGIDWDIVFSKPYQADSVRSEIRRVILQVITSEELVSLTTNFNRQTRKLESTFIYQPDEGQELEGVIEFG